MRRSLLHQRPSIASVLCLSDLLFKHLDPLIYPPKVVRVLDAVVTHVLPRRVCRECG